MHAEVKGRICVWHCLPQLDMSLICSFCFQEMFGCGFFYERCSAAEGRRISHGTLHQMFYLFLPFVSFLMYLRVLVLAVDHLET